MKKVVIAILFFVFVFTCEAQNQVALDSLLNKYYNLAIISKDSNFYKEKFFEIFPDNFQLFNSIYGYIEMDNGYASFSPLYSVSCEHIDKFYATIDIVDQTSYYKKIINISQNGHWAPDAVSCFQINLREILLNNTELFLNVLEFYTDIEIKSFWHFFYDALYYDNPGQKSLYKSIYEKIEGLNNTRILRLMEEQYKYDYNQYLEEK